MSSNLPPHGFLPMSTSLHHETTRVPVTALAFCGSLLVAGEGPFLRFFNTQDLQLISSARVFKAQAVHGISVHPESDQHVARLVIWGGRLVRAIQIYPSAGAQQKNAIKIIFSNSAFTSDWILDLVPRPYSMQNDFKYQQSTFATVTAHNALLQVNVDWNATNETSDSSFISISISELTSSSRSILYSAHLLWESSNRLLIAAGTAFGEIMYWSWDCEPKNTPTSRMHRFFVGHEGSVFGVRISQQLPHGCCEGLKRVVASCSDDRTIRIWDVSEVNGQEVLTKNQDFELGSLRTSHTGFSNEAFDSHPPATSDCLAVGWGHISRIWAVRFMYPVSCNGSLFLLSSGEDATARSWELIQHDKDKVSRSYQLSSLGCAANHNGKNIWSCIIRCISSESYEVICGGADSKITAHTLTLSPQNASVKPRRDFANHTVQEILSLIQPISKFDTGMVGGNPKLKADFFRGYCFVSPTCLLITTNSGKVLVGLLHSGTDLDNMGTLSDVSLITQFEDLRGYSLCTSSPVSNMAFVASGQGTIYAYCNDTKALKKIYSSGRKIGEMLATKSVNSSGQNSIALLVTSVGLKEAQLLQVDVGLDPKVSSAQVLPISEWLTGSTISSMALVRADGNFYVILGFRRGSIALYRFSKDDLGIQRATMIRIIEKSHGAETVTCLIWYSAVEQCSKGYLLSVGKDGKLAVHFVDLAKNIVRLFHQLPLPLGPNIEGLYFHKQHLFVHGFASKTWILYDVTLEEEVMNVETGGAHRTWVFQPHLDSQAGTLVWTRAAGMHIHAQTKPNHSLFQSGGHGREIKAVAVSPTTSQTPFGGLIATGAEDTDIKLFEYFEESIVHRTTIRKHTTGIQHLQWSANGQYLFSSGGCEEFYIWRIRGLPPFLSAGVVCEYAYTPESEYADLRIMSFDVMSKSDGVYIIAMVLSDSSLKVYGYAPETAVRWQSLAKGIYSTCCLTQCMFLSSNRIVTAGTDGNAVVWPLRCNMQRSAIVSSRKVNVLSQEKPTKIHQSSSKTTAYHCLENTRLIVSGGDDGSLAFLLTSTTSAWLSSPPVLLQRAHASAVTACAIIERNAHIFVMSSGNDEWVRLWEVVLPESTDTARNEDRASNENHLQVRRLQKIKTNVADVSCIAILGPGDDGLNASILLCGVGQEVIRLECGP